MASVSQMRQERDGVAVIYKNFLSEKSRGIKYHVFVEGSDDPSYYIHHLSSSGVNIMQTMIYKCRNKDGVLAVYYKMRSLKNDISHMFFMKDKDYDAFLGIAYPKEIYETKYYAIESEMVGENIIKKLWLGNLRNLSADCSFEDMINKWRMSIKSFISNFAQRFYSALIVMQRGNMPYNLDKMSIKDIIDCRDDGRVLTKRGKVELSFNSISDIKLKDLPKAEYLKAKDDISTIDTKSYVIGKHILELFSRFVENYLRTELSKTSPKVKCTIQIQHSNPTISFYVLTDTPDELVAYIQSRI